MKSLLIFLAFLFGALFPQAGRFNFLLRYLIIAMVFLSMLQARFSRDSFSSRQIAVFAANIFFGFAWWLPFRLLGDATLAQAAFFTAITPTAAAAAVVTGMLGGRIDFTINTFILTNLGMAMLFPAVIPPISGRPVPGLFLDVAFNVFLLIGVPSLLALFAQKFLPGAVLFGRKHRDLSFYLWVSAIFLIIANAAGCIGGQWSRIPLSLLLKIAVLSLAICAVNFFCGALLGGKRFRAECSQSLGQKNTTLTIYLAMLYATDPVIALAPTFYVVWHNVWNALQLRLHDRRQGADAPEE